MPNPKAKTVQARVEREKKALVDPRWSDPLQRAEAVAAVVEGRMLAAQAAKEYGVSYSAVLRWVKEDHYEAMAERYQEKLYELQERAILSVEQSVEAMNLISKCASDPEWLAAADPDRINALSGLFKNQSDTVIRFFEAVQRAAGRAITGESQAAGSAAGADGQTKALPGTAA